MTCNVLCNLYFVTCTAQNFNLGVVSMVTAISTLTCIVLRDLYHRTTSLCCTLGVGVSMVRESSTVILHQYFKKKRNFVQIIHSTSTGESSFSL